MSSGAGFANDFNGLAESLEWMQSTESDRIRTYRLYKDLIMLSYYNN